MDTIKLIELYNQFNKIHNQFAAVKRQLIPMDFDKPLFPAEMQVLCLVSSNPEYSISEISESLYITKSAASQLVTKLCNKGFIDKEKDQSNERYTILIITPKGLEAVEKFVGHESYAFGSLIQFMNEHSEDDMNAIGAFLTHLEDMFDKKLK